MFEFAVNATPELAAKWVRVYTGDLDIKQRTLSLRIDTLNVGRTIIDRDYLVIAGAAFDKLVNQQNLDIEAFSDYIAKFLTLDRIIDIPKKVVKVA